MKTSYRTIVFAAGLFGMAVTSADAAPLTLIARIPFAFDVQGHAMPAGKYEFDRDDNFHFLAIRAMTGSNAHGVSLAMPTSGTDPAGDTPALVFTKYETTYRLREVWLTRGTALTLPRLSGDSRLASNTSMGESTVLLAVNAE